MRILLLAHSFNSLTQRLFVELIEAGHEVSVEFDINDAVTREAVALFAPDIVLASFLKRAIPADIWQTHRCLIVHPGIPGGRGPSALDWAILRDEPDWGVTVLQAEAELDGGPVWAEERFPMRAATKSSLYRHEVTDAAVGAVFAALDRIARGLGPLGPAAASPRACARPPCRQADRAIDWAADTTADISRKLRSADGTPGVRDTMFGEAVHLFDAHPARGLAGAPGAAIARARGAVARATRDGAVWIGQVRRPGPLALKRPPAEMFAAAAAALPEIADTDCQPIRYREDGDVGFLSFAFHAGAMGVAECAALRAAYAAARARPTRVLVLLGGPDYWSNGIHLGTIEAADSPADESWRNINAMNDVAHDIITTTDKLVVAVLRGGAGAGGVFLALAADEVWAARGAILNPHYKDMGNLHGSEYWTYLLPRRVEAANARRLMAARLPMGVAEAQRLGLVTRVLPAAAFADDSAIVASARAIAQDSGLPSRLEAKRRQRAADEAARPLESYRAEELARMHLNFYGFDPSYHVARYNFIYKIPKSRTPLTLARHRRGAANRATLS